MKLAILFFSLTAASLAQNLVGSWRLIDTREVRPNGEMLKPYGKTPVGLLIYDDKGNMSAQIQYDNAKGPNDETYIAYFGTYKIDPQSGTVSHIVKGSSRLSYRGTTQMRFVTLNGNLLTLGLLPQMVNGEMRLRSLTWERVQ